MVQGRKIDAEIEASGVVEIPSDRKTVEITARLSLTNRGENAFVAHARNAEECQTWRVFDQNFKDLTVAGGKRRSPGVRVQRGIHSFATKTVPAGQGIHEIRKLTLDAAKLKEGGTYTIRGELYGHAAEATFVAVAAAPAAGRKKPARKKKAKKAKKAAKKAARKARKVAKKARKAVKKKTARAAKKAGKRVKRAAGKVARKAKRAAKKAARKIKKAR